MLETLTVLFIAIVVIVLALLWFRSVRSSTKSTDVADTAQPLPPFSPIHESVTEEALTQKLPTMPPFPEVTFDDYDIDVIRSVVNDLPEGFNTYDVSQHPEMLRAHQHINHHHSYHALVGKLLKNPRRGLGLTQITPDGQSPARWRHPAPSAGG